MARRQLAERIRETFGEVVLGDGIGLWEAQAIDDYEMPAVRLQNRTRDRRTDWAALSEGELLRCQSSLCFFDAEGMRFHLPAYLLLELRSEGASGILFHLVDLSDYSRAKFATLNRQQRWLVRDFLIWCRDRKAYAFERPNIVTAIEEYWSKVP